MSQLHVLLLYIYLETFISSQFQYYAAEHHQIWVVWTVGVGVRVAVPGMTVSTVHESVGIVAPGLVLE